MALKRKDIEEIIEIPEGIAVQLEGERIKLKKDEEEIEKKLEYPVKIEENKVIIKCEKATKKEKKLIKTTAAIIRSLIDGLMEKYVYELKICSVHFPINVSVENEKLIIKNFLGEVKERKATILPGVNVKIDNDTIYVESSDKEKAGQTAANIEQATRIRNRDRRIFQDGIYIVKKCKGKRK